MNETDKKLVNLFNSNVDFLDDEKKTVPIKTTFVEKKGDLDRLTLYNFDGPFQLLYADIENLEFLGKSTADPKYCHLFIDLFTSKVYVYIMNLGNPLRAKRKFFTGKLKRKKRSENRAS